MLNKAQISALIRAIYNGKVNVMNLPKRLYFAIAEHLIEGVYKGYDKTISQVEYESPDFEMLKDLRENVYLFSSAKTFNYVLASEGLIVEGNEVLPFKEFKKRALEVYKEFNETWLEAEYDTAIGQAQSARAWREIEQNKDVLPNLKYVTVHDANVSEICKSIDGVIKPVGDPFWKTYAPLNHYRCRCILQQVGEGAITKTPDDLIKPDEAFQFNPGIARQVFDESHPYFDVPAKYRKFAKKNFGMPLPE